MAEMMEAPAYAVYSQRLPKNLGDGWYAANLVRVGTVFGMSSEALKQAKKLCRHPVLERDLSYIEGSVLMAA